MVDDAGSSSGVVTRRDLGPGGPDHRVRERIRGRPAVVFEDATLREAADHMVRSGSDGWSWCGRTRRG